jgi:23S rRNA (cytidine1920-2'-O)/16S rRNA (cytidine1409-2'-O)-methyltransferase
MAFVSRAGQKLDHALNCFAVDVTDVTCADLGCSTGGFTDCLLQRGAKKVYAVDTGYGVLAWKLRKDARVVVMERTNAMHVELPEPIALCTVDVAWTRQRNILPRVRKLLNTDGSVVTLIKPHYEADASLLRKGILPDEQLSGVMESVTRDIESCGFGILQTVTSPIKGAMGNTEVLAHLRVKAQT